MYVFIGFAVHAWILNDLHRKVYIVCIVAFPMPCSYGMITIYYAALVRTPGGTWKLAGKTPVVTK